MNRRPTRVGWRVLRYMDSHRGYLPARVSPIIFGLNDAQLKAVIEGLQHRQLVTTVPGKVLLTDLGRDELSGEARRRRLSMCGERNGRARLKAEHIPAIREAYANGALQQVLAEQYGITRHTVSRVVRRLNWRDVA